MSEERNYIEKEYTVEALGENIVRSGGEILQVAFHALAPIVEDAGTVHVETRLYDGSTYNLVASKGWGVQSLQVLSEAFNTMLERYAEELTALVYRYMDSIEGEWGSVNFTPLNVRKVRFQLCKAGMLRVDFLYEPKRSFGAGGVEYIDSGMAGRTYPLKDILALAAG